MRLQTTILWVGAVILGVSAWAPLRADSLDGYPLLRESFDPGLQGRLEQSLANLGLGRAVVPMGSGP